MCANFGSADSQPLDQGRGIVIFVNPSAGSAISANPTSQLKDLLPEAEVIELDDDADLAKELSQAAERSKALGVCGGDGSINCGAQVAMEHGKLFAVLPGGTLNHFARDIGITSIEDATTAIIDGRTAVVDVGRIDGKAFLNAASLGAYVELVDVRERLESKIGKWPAALVALVSVLRKGTPLHLEIDGVPRMVWLMFIGNCRYEPPGVAPRSRERLDDGTLDVRIVSGSRPWSRTRLVMAAITGRLDRSKAYESRMANKIEIKSLDGPMRLACDGETFDGSDSFVIEKSKQSLTIYVPGGER